MVLKSGIHSVANPREVSVDVSWISTVHLAFPLIKAPVSVFHKEEGFSGGWHMNHCINLDNRRGKAEV